MTHLVEIEFHPAFPASLKAETEAALASVVPLLGREVALLRVAMMDAGGLEGATACVQVFSQYFQASLWLSGEFFTFDAAKQRKALLHEFGHVLLDALAREAARIVNFYVAEDATKKHLLELLEEMEDRVVEGLALSWPAGDV